MSMIDECIEWDGALHEDGYGFGSFTKDGVRKRWLVHRYIWEENYGPIPPGLCVCHRCDNPPCININHLFLGTIADNNRDMCSKGRSGRQKKTHCPKGHLLEGNNLVPSSRKRGERTCLTCSRWYARERKRKRRKPKEA